jgi:hypothetical protein
VLKQLLDQDWAAKVFANLVQLLNPEPQAARPAAAAGGVHAVRTAYPKPYGWAVTALQCSSRFTIGHCSNVQMLIGSTACHWDPTFHAMLPLASAG